MIVRRCIGPGRSGIADRERAPSVFLLSGYPARLRAFRRSPPTDLPHDIRHVSPARVADPRIADSRCGETGRHDPRRPDESNVIRCHGNRRHVFRRHEPDFGWP